MPTDCHCFVESTPARTTGSPTVTMQDVCLPRSYALFSVLAGVGEPLTEPIAAGRGLPPYFFLPAATMEEFYSRFKFWTYASPSELELALAKAGALEHEVRTRDTQYRLATWWAFLEGLRAFEALGHRVVITLGFDQS